MADKLPPVQIVGSEVDEQKAIKEFDALDNIYNAVAETTDLDQNGFEACENLVEKTNADGDAIQTDQEGELSMQYHKQTSNYYQQNPIPQLPVFQYQNQSYSVPSTSSIISATSASASSYSTALKISNDELRKKNKGKIENYDKEIVALLDSVDLKNEADLKNEINKLTKTKAVVESDKAQRMKMIEHTNIEVDRKKLENAETESKIHELRSKAVQLINEIKNGNKSCSSTKRKISDLRSTSVRNYSDATKEEILLSMQKPSHVRLISTYEAAKIQKKELEIALKESTGEIGALQTSIKQSNELIKTKKAESDQYTAKLKEVYSNVEENITKSLGILNGLIAECKSQEDELKQLEQSVRDTGFGHILDSL